MYSLNDRESLELAGQRPKTTSYPHPYVFFVGCPRSGTTLLQRIVNAHPDLAIIHESHWITRFFKGQYGVTEDGIVTQRLISALTEYRRFPKFKVSREELETLLASGERTHYAGFVSGIFELFGKKRGKTFTGDKTPDYVRDIPFLHRLWPDAKVVHLIRDGRDVCLSVLNWEDRGGDIMARFLTGPIDPVSTVALWWEWHVRVGRESGAVLPANLYYEIRYESLTNDAATQCESLCSFLGVPFDDAMLRFHEGRTKTGSGLDAKKAWLPITRGLRDWRSQMPAEDVKRFEAVAGGLLEELGYPRAFPDLEGKDLEQAAIIRAVFLQQVRQRRKHSLPRSWQAST